jgi:hypothetical protein
MEDLTRYLDLKSIILATIVLLFVGLLLARPLMRRRQENAVLARQETAVIVEQVRSTVGGAISAFFLLLTWVASIVVYAASNTVFQQIEAGVALVAGTILCGLGVALGRRRTYRIYKSSDG